MPEVPEKQFLIIATKIDDPKPSILIGGDGRQAHERAARVMERRAEALDGLGDEQACRQLRGAARSARRSGRARRLGEKMWSGRYSDGRSWRVHLVPAPEADSGPGTMEYSESDLDTSTEWASERFDPKHPTRA